MGVLTVMWCESFVCCLGQGVHGVAGSIFLAELIRLLPIMGFFLFPLQVIYHIQKTFTGAVKEQCISFSL